MDDQARTKRERRVIPLSEADLDRIADRVREKVLQDLYIQIGKGSLKAVLYCAGAVVAALWAWLIVWEHWIKR